MAKTVVDTVAIAWSGIVVVYLIVIATGLFRARHYPLLVVRGARFMMLMCGAAIVHVISATVTHQHDETLEALERVSCVLWGYWLPYLSVGVWFTAQFLQVVTYTAMLARDVSRVGERRILYARPFVALVTMTPPAIIAMVVTALPNASRADAATGACTSVFGAKLAIALWVAMCVLMLAVSLVGVRRKLARDAAREMPRQWIVLLVAVAVAVAQALIVVVAVRGFDVVANRAIATFTVGALYAVAMSVLALRPLWKVLRRDTEYVSAESDRLKAVCQPLPSVILLMDHTSDAPAQEVLLVVADFLKYCASPDMPWMIRPNGERTHPSRLVKLYVATDAWTRRRLNDTAYKRHPMHTTPLYDRKVTNGFPPLISQDITRSARTILKEFFDPPYGTHDVALHHAGQLYMPDDLARVVSYEIKHAIDGEEQSDAFREVLWWALETLDAYFGKTYMTEIIYRRPVWYEQGNVREIIREASQAENLERFKAGGVDFESQSSRHRSTEAAPRTTIQHYEMASSSDGSSDVSSSDSSSNSGDYDLELQHGWARDVRSLIASPATPVNSPSPQKDGE
jgi:hypothetical protein